MGGINNVPPLERHREIVEVGKDQVGGIFPEREI